MIDFRSILSQADQVLGLITQAKGLYDHLKANVADAKDTIGEQDQATLKAKLDQIHALNMELSQELDGNLAILEGRG